MGPSIPETHTIVVHPYLDAQTEFDRYVAHLQYVSFETFLLRAFLHRENIILALKKYFGEHLIGRYHQEFLQRNRDFVSLEEINRYMLVHFAKISKNIYIYMLVQRKTSIYN